MMHETDMIGFDCSISDACALFETISGDRPSARVVDKVNQRDELLFDEFIELLVRCAVLSRAGRCALGTATDARSVLLRLVDQFLFDFYAATDKFYPGSLTRMARRMRQQTKRNQMRSGLGRSSSSEIAAASRPSSSPMPGAARAAAARPATAVSQPALAPSKPPARANTLGACRSSSAGVIQRARPKAAN